MDLLQTTSCSHGLLHKCKGMDTNSRGPCSDHAIYGVWASFWAFGAIYFRIYIKLCIFSTTRVFISDCIFKMVDITFCLIKDVEAKM